MFYFGVFVILIALSILSYTPVSLGIQALHRKNDGKPIAALGIIILGWLIGLVPWVLLLSKIAVFS